MSTYLFSCIFSSIMNKNKKTMLINIHSISFFEVLCKISGAIILNAFMWQKSKHSLKQFLFLFFLVLFFKSFFKIHFLRYNICICYNRLLQFERHIHAPLFTLHYYKSVAHKHYDPFLFLNSNWHFYHMQSMSKSNL